MRFSEQRVDFLNVYVPNVASGRDEFWTMIETSLPATDHLCVGGDFNLLEALEDKQGASRCRARSSLFGSAFVLV